MTWLLFKVPKLFLCFLDKIEDTVNFRNTRYEDKKQLDAQLELENTNYAEETEIYTDLKNEYLRQLAVTE